MRNIKEQLKNSYKYLILGIFILSFILISKVAFGVPGDPTVNVTASPASIQAGGTSSIHWESTNADFCSSPGGGGTGTSGTFTTPALNSNTTYTVTCTNDNTGGTSSDSVTVIIGTTPVITTLTATPSTVSSGGTSSIHWESAIATSCTLSPGNGTGTTGTFTTPALTSNTTYTLNCASNSGATVSQTVTVTVGNSTPPGNPITVGVYASPNPIYSGNNTTISWSSTGATYCQSLPGGLGGGVGKTGTFVTSKLTSNTTYTVSCNVGGFCKTKPEFTSYVWTCKQDEEGNAITDAKTCNDRLGPDNVGKVCTWDNSTITATNQNSVLVTVLPPPGTPGNSITDIYTKKVSTDVSDKKTMVKFLGEMNPGGDPNVVAYFRYSTVAPGAVTPIFCNQIYGSNMRATNEIPVRGNTIRQVSIEEGGLEPNTTYYYCVVGSTTNQIDYGGVMSFTTEGELSITTNSATVVDSGSAYLKGFYNTNVPAKTWFEYRKRATGKEQQSTNVLSKIMNTNIFDYFFKTEHARAAINTKTDPSAYGWRKVDERTQKQKSNGNLSFLLKGLASGTVYEFRAVIKDNINSVTRYGIISSFKTKGTGSTEPGGGGGGVGYQDPCANIDSDINCNGTGGDGGGGGTGILGDGLPDLTAGPATLSSYIVNTPMIISATIRNLGGASTNSAGNNNIKNILPGTQNISAPKAGQTSFLNFFKTEKAVAVTSGIGTTSVTSTQNFYNFFQVSTRPQSSTDSASGINSAIVNFPAVPMAHLGPNGSNSLNQNYTFPSVGTYYIRACADKRSPTDVGLIRESYEDNNCGPWSMAMVSIDGNQGWDNDGDDEWNDGWDSGDGNGENTGSGDLTLGQNATPPDLAIVRYHEGIETVLYRQIIENTELKEGYGYKEGDNLEAFAWQLSDYLARRFGYVAKNGKEIRVSLPDIAAYQLSMKNGILTIYEYYDGKIVNIQSITNTLRNIYKYEYYFRKIVSKVF